MKTNKQLKRLLAVILIVITSFPSQELTGQAAYYQEYFNNPKQLSCGQFMWINDMTGVDGSWNIDVSECPEKDAAFNFCVINNKFSAWNLRGEAVWYSRVIDIKGLKVSASVLLNAAINMEANDYIKVFYKLNGGKEILMNNGAHYGNFYEQQSASVTSIKGSTLQIIIRVKNNDMLEKHYFDNILIEGVDLDKIIYEENSANNAPGKTWGQTVQKEKLPLEILKINEDHNGCININLLANCDQEIKINMYSLMGQLMFSQFENITYSGLSNRW